MAYFWQYLSISYLGSGVADPNDAPMYANRSRRSKTDKRDSRTLMDACETGAYRPAYRRSEARRHVRAELAVRDALVRTRTRYRSRRAGGDDTYNTRGAAWGW